jgi:hypothetical protein
MIGTQFLKFSSSLLVKRVILLNAAFAMAVRDGIARVDLNVICYLLLHLVL